MVSLSKDQLLQAAESMEQLDNESLARMLMTTTYLVVRRGEAVIGGMGFTGIELFDGMAVLVSSCPHCIDNMKDVMDEAVGDEE